MTDAPAVTVVDGFPRRRGVSDRWDLPVHFPEDAEELKATAAEPLRLTAYQYCAECPGSDLAEVLSERKDFAAALLNAAAPVAAAVTGPTAPQ